MQKTLIHFLGICLVALSVQACYTKPEGCTDPVASNFDPEADVNTGCTYFLTRVKNDPKYNGLDFQLDTFAYLDLLNDSFKVEQATFFVSGFRFEMNSGELVQVLDSFQLPSGQYTGKDYLALNPSASFQTLGRVSGYGNFQALRFNIGLSDLQRSVDATQQTAGSTLSNSSLDSMYNSTEGFAHFRLVIRHGSGFSQRSVFSSYGNGLQIPIQVSGLSGIIPDNENHDLVIQIDYGQLLFGIAFNSDSNAAVVQKIRDNLPSAIIAY